MADFEFAIKKILNAEGGYTNNPADPGGETKFGISKRSYPHIDIKSLTVAQAKEIYKNDFWLANKYDQIANDFIAEQALDLAVNIGPANANKILQKAYNFLANCANELALLSVDGTIGKNSIAAINSFVSYGENAIYLVVIERLAAEYYNRLHKPMFVNGWLKRLFENALMEKEGAT